MQMEFDFVSLHVQELYLLHGVIIPSLTSYYHINYIIYIGNPIFVKNTCTQVYLVQCK